MKKLALLLALLMAVSVVPAFAAEKAPAKEAEEVAAPAKEEAAPAKEEAAPAKEEVAATEDEVAVEEKAVATEEELAADVAAVEALPAIDLHSASEPINYKTAVKTYERGYYAWSNVTEVPVDAPENVSIATRGTIVAGYDIDITEAYKLSYDKYCVIAVPYTKDTKGTAIYADYENGRVIRIPVSYVETDAEAGTGVAYVRYPYMLAATNEKECQIARLIFVETEKPVNDITFDFLQYVK